MKNNGSTANTNQRSVLLPFAEYALFYAAEAGNAPLLKINSKKFPKTEKITEKTRISSRPLFTKEFQSVKIK